MEILAIAGTSFLVGFSGSLIPGPMLTVNITQSLRRGFWAGPLMVAGHGIVEILLLLGLAFGLGQWLQLPMVSTTIGIVGGAVLLLLAYSILRGVRGESLTAHIAHDRSRYRMGPVLAGGLVSISNPTWVLWWATIGVSYVAWASVHGATGLAAFFGGHILSDLLWYSFVALLVTGGRQFLGDRLYRAMLALCGVFLIGLSAYFVFSSLRNWPGA